MSTIADRVRGQAKDLVDRFLADAKEHWGDFRATSIYFQLRALVLITYCGLVAFTVLYVPLDGIHNAIGARITVLDGDMVVGRYFIISNEGREHWHNVTVELDGGFRFEQELVAAGTRLELFSTSFRKKEMRKRRGREIAKWSNAPPDAELTELRVSTRDGTAAAPIPPRGEKPSGWF
ncbi:MAG: hypothetical protein AAFX94_17645 [Myxococcota bacterium]